MALVEWDEERFSVHVKEFDDDHRMLVHVISDLHSALKSGQARDVLVRPRVGYLAAQAQYHLSAEETWLEARGYPKLRTHRQEHFGILKRILEFQTRLLPQDVEAAIEFLEFGRTLLVDHVLSVDREYALFFESHHAR